MKNVSEEMKHLHKLAKENPSKRFNHLWENLICSEWLAQAWEEIRRHKGSQTAGVDNTNAIDVDMTLIDNLAEELKTRKYRPKPVRRVHIPKATGKTRPLGIPTIKDRIVQQALRMLLDPVFEADFLNCSHGFRQGLSTHTALRDVACGYASTSWVIEGDIEGCFDNVNHGKLIKLIEKRIADKKILSLVKAFLEAGYMEDWQYHKTYSGTPQGGIISPLLANIFLHQLDQFMEDEFEANRTQTKRQSNSRRNPEYRKVENQITRLRRMLKETDEEGRKLIIDELKELEKQRKSIPIYAKGKKHPCKVKYVRYADDFVILVSGNKQETEAIRDKIKQLLSQNGLRLSDEKTNLTHWSKTVHFLGYNLQGKMRAKGVGIKPVLSVPQEKLRKAIESIKQVGSYYHIPEVDVLLQVNAIYRGWCNYYKYANSPQKVFEKLARKTWWEYAHFIARKHKSSIAKMIQRERKAKGLGEVKKGGRKRYTFQVPVGKRSLILDIFPPKTGKFRTIPNKSEWNVDLKPITPLNWQSGRSLATRLQALDRAKGVCERCKENPIAQVHHTIPMRGKTFLARIMSDKSQRETAVALCEECHLEVHGGSFNPKQRSSGNAGCAERRLSGVGTAS